MVRIAGLYSGGLSSKESVSPRRIRTRAYARRNERIINSLNAVGQGVSRGNPRAKDAKTLALRIRIRIDGYRNEPVCL